MPLNSSPRKRSNTRPRAYAALLAALLMLSAAALFGTATSAQRKNDNTSQQGRSSRRVIVGRGSDTASGSRTTITADDSLNDYSAYRSGDRFYVVLPKSAAGAVSKGSGKGYTDVQVQQRGDSVVVSYKVQPGAKPRVEQKFNRLDVVFDMKEGGQPAGQGQQTAGTAQQPANENRNPSESAQQQQQQSTAQPKPSTTPAATNERRPTEAASNTGQPGAANPSNNATQPGETAQQPGAAQTQPAPSPTGEQAAPTAEPQIAQNQPPAPIAPITNPDSTNAGAQAGVSFGTMLAKNWPIPLFVALLLVGLGLVIFARRSTSRAPEELEAAEAVTTTATLPEPRVARLKDSKDSSAELDSVTAKPAPLAEVAPLVTTTPRVSGKKNKKKKKRGKVVEERAKELPLAEAKPAEESSVAASPAEIVAPSAEETLVAEPETPTVEAPAAETEPAIVEAPAVAPIHAAEDSAQAVENSTTAVEDVAEVEASREASALPEVVAAEAPTVEAPVVESVSRPVVETVTEHVAESVAEPVTGIAPAGAPDPEEVQAQTRRLLEGESYEHSVIGSEDSMARQMIGAELLSALAGRNAERRERARSAFVEHGYFDEKVRDVREAAAPAERAAAARSLAIVGDRAASHHLIAALGDDSMEVRRAAVEALGALREPSAVEPLEALLRREKNQRNRIPNRIIQHAIETCRFAAVEEVRAETERARAEAEAPAVAEVVETEPVEEEAVEPIAPEPEAFTHEVVEASPVAEIAPVEEAAPQVEETALIEKVSPREVEVAPAEEVKAGETAVVAASDDAASAVEEPALPFETAHRDVETTAPEIQTAFETPSAVETQPAEEQTPVGEAAALEELTLETEGVETPVAESNAVEPFLASPQAFESAVAETHVTEETSAVAEEPSVEPAAETLSSELTPSVSTSEAEESASAGEWEELDMSEIQAPPPSESLFEFSSGEAMSSAGVAEPEELTLDVESRTFEKTEETRAFETAFEARGVEAAVEPTQAENAFESREVEEVAGPSGGDEYASAFEPSSDAVTAPLPSMEEKGVVPFNERSTVPAAIQQRLTSRDAFVRAAAITELSHVDSDEAFQQICSAFDDDAKEVRSAAARALYELHADRAESFTRALREASPDRRRNVGSAISSSGLAGEAISQLTGESRDKTYEAFSLLFLMAKAGEVQPLVRAIEAHPNNEVRLAVVKLLALSGQKEILPAFRRLAVRGSLPTEVRSAVMEAIYQISSSQPTPA